MATSTPSTPFSYKCKILAGVYLIKHPDFDELQSSNDLAFALAFGIDDNLVLPTEEVVPLVEDGFDRLLTFFGVEDKGYEDFQQLLEETQWYENYLLEEDNDDNL